jgi:hypothetical protein
VNDWKDCPICFVTWGGCEHTANTPKPNQRATQVAAALNVLADPKKAEEAYRRTQAMMKRKR